MGKLQTAVTLPKKILLQGWAGDQGDNDINGEYIYGKFTLLLQERSGYIRQGAYLAYIYSDGYRWNHDSDDNGWNNSSSNPNVLPLNGWIPNNAQGPAGSITILENISGKNTKISIKKQNLGGGRLLLYNKFTPNELQNLSLWLKADTGVTLGTYVSQIILTCTGSLSSYSGTYIATSAPDAYGAYSLFSSANSKTIFKEGFGEPFTIGPDFTLASSEDGINWSLGNVLAVGMTISGATGSYTGANGTYELNERTQDSGDIYRSNQNGYYGLVNTSGAVDIFGPDYSLLYYNTSFGSGAWGNENGTGTVTASSITLDPSGTVSGSITTSPISIVTAWADQSGNGNNTSQGSETLPTYALIGGKSFISFQSNVALVVNSIWNGVQFVGTIFIVVRFESSANAENLLGQEGIGGALAFGRKYNGTNAFAITTDFIDVVNSSSLAGDNTSYLLGTTFSESLIATLYLNGASAGSGAIANVIGSQYAGTSIGGGSGSSNIAEVVVYNRVLTTQERQQVEAYLNDKYNIY